MYFCISGIQIRICMYIHRSIENIIRSVVDKIPVIVLTGPRQSGKTTLSKMLFSDFHYYNLEFPDTFEIAKNDPRFLFKDIEQGIIIDEVQKLPALLSYIQAITDAKKINGKIILTGSQNFNLTDSVNQSLAGRTIHFTLLPFSIDELKKVQLLGFSNDFIFKGCYPRIYDQNIDPHLLLNSYIQSYVERDVRQMVNIKDLTRFQLFIKIIAGRVGQIINYQAFASEIGVDAKTIRNWLAILEASYIIFHLKPYYKNFNKRLIKSSKIYFYDTGIVCSLLGIREAKQLDGHYIKGGLFENMVIADLKKRYFNMGLQDSMYFWRDSSGNEIDCIIEHSASVSLIEIKSSMTFHNDFHRNIDRFTHISTDKINKCYIVYNGEESFPFKNSEVIKWDMSAKLELT